MVMVQVRWIGTGRTRAYRAKARSNRTRARSDRTRARTVGVCVGQARWNVVRHIVVYGYRDIVALQETMSRKGAGNFT
jgi:hypothetical protein